MILVDTSVWIDHFRRSDALLAVALDQGLVVTHTFVIGELACGNLNGRNEILRTLGRLRRLATATDSEVLHLIESRSLMGSGIGYIDAHLLSSAVIADGVSIWTRDQRLATVAESLGVVFKDVVS